MIYRELGRSGLQVSAYGLGVMTFGGQTPEADAMRQLDIAFAAGITLFDTAENYPTPISAETQGRSEAILGRWIAVRGVRDKVVVATKVAGPGNAAGDLRHIRGDARRLDRSNIALAVDESLRRLGIDHIDLYQVHWPDRAVSTLGRSRYSLIEETDVIPIEETLAALGEQVAAGKIRHVGVCNETPWGAMRYLAASATGELPRIAAIQNGYSLLNRYVELGLAETIINEQLGLLAYSPLAGGLLTGKYVERGAPIPGSRSSQSSMFLSRLSVGKRRAIAAYVDLAHEYGLDPSHMALAFAAAQPFMTSVLMAASTVPQLEANLAAIDLTLPKELVQTINAVHDANPNPK